MIRDKSDPQQRDRKRARKDTMYEIVSNYGATVFNDKDDAVKAVWLLGPYHGMTIDVSRVTRDLDKNGYYEAFPLAITVVECE